MAPTNKSVGNPEGFAGAVAGLTLTDVIQMSGANRFSGCITIQNGASTGLVFFQDGEIVHADRDGKSSGLDAFYDIMEWRTGRFSLQPNVSTTHRTIRMGAQHLLLEAHRVIDERRARGAGLALVQDAAPPAPRGNSVTAILEQLRGISGVSYAAVMAKDGACVGDQTFEAETIAAHAVYLGMAGDRVGGLFRAGPIQSAVVEGASKHVLLFVAKNNYLGVVLQSDAEAGAVEAQVRKVLATNR